MSFSDCIQRHVEGGEAGDAGKLTKKQVEVLLNKYDGLVKRYAKTMGDDSAAHAAAQKMVTAQAELIKAKKWNTIRGLQAQERLVQDLTERMQRNKSSIGQEVSELLERAYRRGKGVFRWGAEDLNEFIDKFRAKWAGLSQDHEGMKKVVRALVGEVTDDADANMFAKQLREMFDKMHMRHKNAGGIMGKIDNYFPQVHESHLVSRVSAEEWAEDLFARLDLDKMINEDTGLPFTRDELMPIMLKDHKTISTNGLSDLQERIDKGMRTTGQTKGVAERKNKSRFYHFKDADSFLEYNRKFGTGDTGLFNAVVGNMHTMARDIGIMETLGPMPNSVMKHFELRMEEAGTSMVRTGHVKGMYDVLTGRTNGGEMGGFSRGLANLQDLMRSAYLGSAPLSAISDSTFVAMGARANGLSATKALKEYMRQLNPASSKSRAIAERSGYIAESASGMTMAGARFAEDAQSRGAFRWLATFTNQASGLQHMTDAAKHAVTLELQGAAADAAGKSWSKLDPTFRKAAEDNGLTEKYWDIIRKAEKYVPPERKKARFIRPQEIVAVEGVSKADALEAAARFDDWIENTRSIVANEPALRTRAVTTGAAFGDARQGTVMRNTASSLMMFKGFPITMMFNHLIPALRKARDGQGASRFADLGILAIGTTVLGAVGLQMAEIVKGRDGRDMDDGRFWAAAAAKGGGLSLFGDFFFADHSRFGRPILVDMMGPVVGFSNDVARISMGNFQRALDDDSYDTLDRFRGDTYAMLKRHIPAGTLWYSRLALERGLLDQIGRVADPNYDHRMRRVEQRLQRDYNQRYWWAPGETSPDRAPEM